MLKRKNARGIVPKKADSGQFTEVIIKTSHNQTPLLDPIHDCGTNQLISTELGQVSLKVYHLYPCADPEGGTGGPDPPPPWNLKILPKKR